MKQIKFNYLKFWGPFLIIIWPSIAMSQTEVFLSKPDPNIYRVIGIEKSGETPNDTALIMEYNRNGLLVSESVPKFYIFIDYRYDSEGRLIEREALYGESFANGTTFYSYSGDTLVEKSLLMNSFQKKIKVLNNEKQVSAEITYYAAGQSTDSYIENVNYSYLPSGKLKRIECVTQYHDYSKEAEDYYEMDEDLIISELQLTKKIREEKTYTEFNYKNDLPISEITYNSGSGKKLRNIKFKYDDKTHLIEKKEVTYAVSASSKQISSQGRTTIIYRYKYNQEGQLIENSQINRGYSSTKFYKDGKLIKETEAYDDKKIEGTLVTYQYVYY